MSALPVPDNRILAVIAGICSISYLYFGIYILSIAPDRKPNRAFFHLCLFSCLWSLCYIIYYLNTDARVKDIMERLIYLGMTYVALLLRLVIIFTDIIKNKKLLRYIFIIIWLPSLLIAYKSVFDNAIAKDFPFGPWYMFTSIFMLIYNLTSITIFVIYYLKYTINKRRRGLMLGILGLIIIPFAWAADYMISFHGSLNLLPFWVLLWIYVALYSIGKYRFITITPKMINKDISENVEEGIILLDPNLKIIFKNSALLNMLNLKDSDIAELQDIVLEKEILNKNLSDLVRTDKVSFAIRINLIPRNAKKRILTDIKVKKIIDDYKDISGFLIIALRVKDLEQLVSNYKISRRELDVIHHIIAGSTNKEIAEILEVTEATIKTHITSIYGKLLIKNRIELLNLLSKFNILSKAGD